MRRLDHEYMLPRRDLEGPSAVGVRRHDVTAIRNEHARNTAISDPTATVAAPILEDRAEGARRGCANALPVQRRRHRRERRGTGNQQSTARNMNIFEWKFHAASWAIVRRRDPRQTSGTRVQPELFPPDLIQLRRPCARRSASRSACIRTTRALKSDAWHRSRSATRRASVGGRPEGTGAFVPWRRRTARPWLATLLAALLATTQIPLVAVSQIKWVEF
jgi:hypothetical protein